MDATLKKKEKTLHNIPNPSSIDHSAALNKNQESQEYQESQDHKLNKLDILILNNGWNDKNEQLIVSLGYNAGIYKQLHDKSVIKYTYYNTILNISLLTFSIFLTTDSILNVLRGDILNIIQKIITFIVTFISVLTNFLKYEVKAIQHKQSAQSFNLIYNDIRNMMCIYRKDRTNAIRYIQHIVKEYDYLEISSPEISPNLIKQLKQEIDRDDTIKNKNIMPNNTFKEIEVSVDTDKTQNKNKNMYSIESKESDESEENGNNFNITEFNADKVDVNKYDYPSHLPKNANVDNHKFKINNMQNLEEIHNCFRIDGDLSEKDNITLHDIQQYRNNGLNLQTQYEMTRFMHHHS
jgi:hypothetical protein